MSKKRSSVKRTKSEQMPVARGLSKSDLKVLKELLATNPRKFNVLRLVFEKGLDWKKAMEASGYSKAYAKNSKEFTDSSQMQKALDVLLEGWFSKKVHLEILDASDIQTWTFDSDEINDEVVDALAAEVYGELLYVYNRRVGKAVVPQYVVKLPKFGERRQALDMLYKLQGAYAPEKYEVSGDLAKLSDEELEDLEKQHKLKLDRYKEHGSKRSTKGSKSGKAKKSDPRSS